MKCQWQELLNLLPVWMRKPVDEQGREDLQELRLRHNSYPQLVKKDSSAWLQRCVTNEDISFCINTATRYSPWTSGSVAQGYITAPGGHRIGLCGDCVLDGQVMKTMGNISSLCIRVARDIDGLCSCLKGEKGSVLIIGRPGSGKTTFLRDLIRQISTSQDLSVAVIDERRELFPSVAGKFCFERGMRTDVLCGARKSAAIEIVLRTMNPGVIAVDEITAAEDCNALYDAAWCGVRLLATAHAESKKDLYSRKLYEPLIRHGIFSSLIIMHPDKTWHKEVISQCS